VKDAEGRSAASPAPEILVRGAEEDQLPIEKEIPAACNPEPPATNAKETEPERAGVESNAGEQNIQEIPVGEPILLPPSIFACLPIARLIYTNEAAGASPP